MKPAESSPTKVLVIGLGNPILGDDGVGWRVVDSVQNKLGASTDTRLAGFHDCVETDCLSLGGLSLMERLVGYHRAIIVDALSTGQTTPGTLSCFNLEELPRNVVGHLGSAHDASLQDAIAMGRSLGARLPETVVIIGIEIHISYDFSEQLSPAVALAVPQAENKIIDLLAEWIALK